MSSAIQSNAFAAFKSRLNLAYRNVWRQKSRNSMLGLLISFATFMIIYFSQFLEGVSENFSSNLIALASGDIYISSTVERDIDKNIFDRDYEYFLFDKSQEEAMKKLVGMGTTIDPRMEFDAKLVTSLDSLPYQVMAFDVNKDAKLRENFRFIEGGMFSVGKYEVIVPIDFAKRNEIKVGDRIRLLGKAFNKQINLIDYKVTGLFATQNLSAWFDNYVYINLDVARVLINHDDVITRLNINLPEEVPVDVAINSVNTWLKTNSNAQNPPLNVTHWKEGAETFGELTGAMQLSYFIVISIIVVMMAASIAFTTMINILERKKEIATLGALGASPGKIRNNLMLENALLAILFVALGVLIAVALYFLTSRSGIPIHNRELRGFLGSSHFFPAINIPGYVLGVLTPLVVAALSSFIFGYRVTKIPITEAIADR